MGDRNKQFSHLSSRHKRRRISAIRNAEQVLEDIADNDVGSSSSSDGRAENVETLEVPPPFVPAVAIENFNDEQLSTDNEESESSAEEESEEEVFDGNDFQEENVEVQNQINDSSASEDEIEDINVHENPMDLNKRVLKNAFLAANLNHKQGNIILKTLREFPFNLIFLPKDTRTLLQTPTVVASRLVQEIAGGEYLHIGFKKTLLKKLENLPENKIPDRIVIDFSTDGAQLNNGGQQFWPLQFRVFNIHDKRPMIAGVFKGKHKPSNVFDFFEQFVQEIIDVRTEGGILLRNRRLPLVLRCFIADAPARAFALNHYGHMSSNACSKCKIEGHRCTVPGFGGTMVFPGIRNTLRTDEEYQNILDEDHHKGRSPLTPILPLVSRVPFESLHSIWLGNVKKVLAAQIDGKFGFQRLNGRKLNIIDSRMLLMREYCPSEFNRRPNAITAFHSFKGTEFRQLLLYTAPAVLKSVLNQEHYDHLMILHSVIRLLVSEETPQEMYAFCQEALETYVILCEQLYGEQFLSYNVHALLHIVSDVQLLGGLDTFSAFCYENNMPEFRKYLRKPHLTLQQYYKRLGELNNFIFAPLEDNIPVRLSQPHAEGPLPEGIAINLCRQFHKLRAGSFTFANSSRDNCCTFEDSKMGLIKNVIQVEGAIFLVVQEFLSKNEIYDVGVSSEYVGVCRCSILSDKIKAVHLNNVKNKTYRMPLWSNSEGEEENVVEDEWICVNLLSPLVLPRN